MTAGALPGPSANASPTRRIDVAIIGAGPGGSAAAITAARAGCTVEVWEKGAHGRDKVCGDGLTPRAILALTQLGIDPQLSHITVGLRMVANSTVRELDWPGIAPFPAYGGVWPRTGLDAHLADTAAEAGATIHWSTEATPLMDGDRAIGVEAGGERVMADLVVLAAGAPGSAARILGATRNPSEPHGLAIRAYVPSPRHTDQHLEACLTLTDEHGTAVPGYGWMFPAGDGTVNIGVGALSTMKGFKKLNLNRLLDQYRALVAADWQVGDYLEKPRAWRLPMSAQRRHGPGWVAIGDAAGLINPMNGEGIDYALESGIAAIDCFVNNPAGAPADYDRTVGDRYDAFLDTGRRFSFLIGHPLILRNGLRMSVSTDAIAKITLQVMGNLVDTNTPGASGWTMRTANRMFALADPVLRATARS